METKITKVCSLVLCLLLVAMAFAGCSKDKPQGEESSALSNAKGEDNNEETKESENPLVGSWKSDSFEAIYTFNDDGTGEYDFYGDKKPFTYTDNGDSVEIKYETDTVSSVFKYVIEDDVLNIEDSFGEMYKYTKK